MKILFVSTIVVIFSWQIQAASNLEIESFAREIEMPLKSTRYMEETCLSWQIPGWEGFETSKCTYNVKDPKTGKRKSGLVVMLNPSSRDLAVWVLNACETVSPNENRASCSSRVFRRILEQSGGQFPIAGIVYEDLIPKDGILEAYGFSNGVTTILNGVQHRRTTPFSAAELESGLVAQPLQTASSSAYARVIGVTREQFQKSNPKVNVSGLNWLSVVKEEHKKAMRSGRNSLIEAWLSDNPPN